MEVARFINPALLWLLLVLLPMVGYYVYRTLQGGATIQISSVAGLGNPKRTFRYYLRHLPFVLRAAVVACVVVALARPQSVHYDAKSQTEGIDIVLALDVSGSMLARDFNPDRITVAKQVASKFITDRPNDRIGIVLFAAESYTQSPLTTDKRSLLGLLSKVDVEHSMLQGGTAIGLGLATSVNRLRESDAESKVVILLTDGDNNAGNISPDMAADIAKTMGVKVYTVGVGTNGVAQVPVVNEWGQRVVVPMNVKIDEELLRDMAIKTGGLYFRATDEQMLFDIYDKINRLEKTELEANDIVTYNELFPLWLAAALVLMVLEFIVKNLILRRIP